MDVKVIAQRGGGRGGGGGMVKKEGNATERIFVCVPEREQVWADNSGELGNTGAAPTERLASGEGER